MKIFNKYKFSDKNQTLGGTLSLLLGIGSLVCLFYGVYLSFKAHGNAGIEVGSLGMLAFMLSTIGSIIGFLSFKENDKFYTLSKIGTLICGIMTVMMAAIFMMGI